MADESGPIDPTNPPKPPKRCPVCGKINCGQHNQGDDGIGVSL